MRYHFSPPVPGDGSRKGEWAKRCRIRTVSTRCGFDSETEYYARCPYCGKENIMQGKAPAWRELETCEHLTRFGFQHQGTYMYFRKV